MRNTLVIRGLREKENEKWDDTTETLAKFLAHINKKGNDEEIKRQIQRCHRGKIPNVKNGPRAVFVNFVSWKDSQTAKSLIIQNNISLKQQGKSVNVFVDQLYSKELMERRKQALDERNKLKENGSLAKMFIKYPAKLMVKRGGNYVTKKKKKNLNFFNPHKTLDIFRFS